MFDSKVHVLDHPLLQHKLSILRDERTGVKEFREIVSEIATLECYEATRDLPLEDVEIKTPVATGTFKCLTGKKLAIVPILRAGLGMVDGILTLIPPPKWGAHRPVPGPGDPGTGGVLLQDASRHRRAGRHRPGSHAGYRRLRRGGHPVPEKL